MQPPTRILPLAIGAIAVAAVVAVSSGEPPTVRLVPATAGADAPDDSDGRVRDARPSDDPTRRTAPATGGDMGDEAASTFDAGGAGTVTYAVRAGELVLVDATPASGWVVDVETARGVELDLDFRSGTRRVQVDVEFEDTGVRERVRVRDDAAVGDATVDDDR